MKFTPRWLRKEPGKKDPVKKEPVKMSVGAISHLDISVSSPRDAIKFYDAFFTSLGYKRWYFFQDDDSNTDWQEPNPRRASWSLKQADGSYLGFEVRPASAEEQTRRYNRYEPGPHHLAFNAGSKEHVDEVYQAMMTAGAEVLDPPVDYGGQAGYSDGYYAVFFADPDGFKLEVVFTPPRAPRATNA